MWRLGERARVHRTLKNRVFVDCHDGSSPEAPKSTPASPNARTYQNNTSSIVTQSTHQCVKVDALQRGSEWWGMGAKFDIVRARAEIQSARFGPSSATLPVTSASNCTRVRNCIANRAGIGAKSAVLPVTSLKRHADLPTPNTWSSQVSGGRFTPRSSSVGMCRVVAMQSSGLAA